MSHYVISRGDLSRPGGFLDAVVISTGRADDGKAVALFTNQEHANSFLQTANWNQRDRVVQLQPGELGQWLFAAIRSGVRYLAIDPSSERKESDLPRPVVDLQSQLECDGFMLSSCLSENSKTNKPSNCNVIRSTQLFLVTCEVCHRIAVVSELALSTACCGTSMTPLQTAC